MVPKLIHQLWAGDRPMPSHWMDRWRMDGFDYRLWTEANLTDGPWVGGRPFDFYMARRYWPGVKDAILPHILHTFGGVFTDADSVPLRDWTDAPFMDSSGFAARTEPHPRQPDRLGVSIVGAVAGSPVMARWIDIQNRLPRFTPEWDTMVPALTRAVAEVADPDFLILPQGTFYPVGLRGGRDDTVEPWAEHYWGATRGLYE